MFPMGPNVADSDVADSAIPVLQEPVKDRTATSIRFLQEPEVISDKRRIPDKTPDSGHTQFRSYNNPPKVAQPSPPDFLQ